MGLDIIISKLRFMIPQYIIDDLGLVATTQVIGQSFIQNETIYEWPKFLDNVTTYIMGCDEVGVPLVGNKVFIYCTWFDQGNPPQKYYLSKKLPYEMLILTEIEYMRKWFQKDMERIESKCQKT
jgi:hypothetical protein